MLLTVKEEFYNSMLTFYSYFHIQSSNNNISFINVKMGGGPRCGPTAQPPFLQL